tara:strand:- start:147 stop:407 length:261 start_codon:yes stop_codon:yes gene_type:complete
METNVVTFSITTSFDEWVKVYDGSIEMAKQAGIISLFRGVDKEDPTKVCVVMQAQPGVIDSFMASNAEMIASSGHVLESTVVSVYL